ncbi:hypothetical protein, partial [Mesorhizobium sp. B1-1-5]|uniref:hypothetical protein n=1 Tax=Mesorhizobium sp. B1-1-5 TaxID=2589979 RepID=UPI001AED81D3
MQQWLRDAGVMSKPNQQLTATTAFPVVEPGDRRALRRMMNQINGLKPDIIKVLVATIDEYWLANGALPEPSPHGDQPEPSSPRREEVPSR